MSLENVEVILAAAEVVNRRDAESRAVFWDTTSAFDRRRSD